jgi:hypothetical protein
MLDFIHNILRFLILNFLISPHTKMPQEDQPNLKDPSLSDPLASDYIQSTPLSLWLQSRISGLYEAVPPTEEADFKALYYTTFDIDASIYMNHEKVSQDTYLARLNSANFAVTHATVNWKELIDASPSSTEKEEDVKVRFTVTYCRTQTEVHY